MMPLVDVHTHLFNHRHIPVEGLTLAFLRARDVPDAIARPTAHFLRLLISYLAESDRDARAVASAAHAAGDERAIVKTVARVAAQRQSERLMQFGIHGFPHGMPSKPLPGNFLDVLREADRWHGLMTEINEKQTGAPIDALKKARITVDLPQTLDRLSRDVVRDRLLAPILECEGGFGYVRFVFALLEPVPDIWRRLRGVYPREMDLYVHLMMDMKRAYEVDVAGKELKPEPCAPALDYEAMVAEMAALHWQAQGRLVSFVAFDPRRSNAVELVKKAIEQQGFIGVKVYPPMGYRPIDPRYSDVQWRLYDYCSQNHVPIMSHCSPKGFEAYAGHGNYADPAHADGWQAVLARYGDLRLCLGHAGAGEDENYCQVNPPKGAQKQKLPGWYTTPIPASTSSIPCFAASVIELCKTHPNVYCDFSYFMKAITDTPARDNLASNLRHVLQDPVLGSKLMYGSDWHMPEAIPLADDGYDMFRAIFDGEGLIGSAGDFFGANAIRFLNLGEAVVRYRASHPSLTPMEKATLDRWEALSAQAG